MTQCNCKNTDELRIVRGNAFAIRLTVSAIHIDGTPVENFVLGDAEAVLKVMHLDEKTPKEFLIIGNDAIINFGGDLSLGWYGFEMTGTFNGKPWRWCVTQVFQVVETNAKANIPAWAVLTDETYAINGVMTITSGDIYQSDWDETDPQSPSYIKNKPDVVLHPEFNETVQRIDRDMAAEETRAKAAEKQNADDIDTIEGKIPSAASSENKLVDKQQMDNATADFITKSVNDLVNYYLKSDTYTKSEVQQLIAAVKQFTYEVVQTLPTASASTMNKIYLVPSTNPKTENVKDEYITIATETEEGGETVTTYSWEQIGSTTVDLSGYYTSAQTDTAISNALTTALADYSTTSEMNTAITNALNTALADYSTTTEMTAAIATAIANYYTKSEVDALIANFITKSVNDLVNYYLKSDTYTKSEVQQLIAAVKQFTYEVVQTLPTASASTMNKIYLVPSTNPKTENVKDEYITIATETEEGGETVTTYSWEQIGSTTVDLSGYYTIQQTDAAISSALTNALADYTTTANLTTLLSGKEDKSNKVTSLSAESTDTQYPSAKCVYDLHKQNADDIADIEDLIPAQTTPQNQLADKQFVNSSISTATATYRGSYNLVSDLELTTAATEQQIAAALTTKMTALGIEPDNNDYCFVQVPTADATPTEIVRVDRYKFNGTAWAFEFSLNNSGFTAAQWAALNSGITSGLVTKLSDLPTNAGLTTLLNGKQDTISDLQTIREGAAAGALAAPQATTYTKTEVDGLLLTKQAVITDGAQIGGGYGVCTTAASTVAKEVTIANFLLLKNMPVSVKFESAISVDSATLNINSTGAKPIFIQGAALQPGVVKAEDVVTLIYDGTNFNIVEILSVSVSQSDLYVDMGLPSGTLWAIANLDATTQSGFAEVDGKPSPFKYECTFFSWGNNVGHNPISDSVFDYDWGTSNIGTYASTPGATLTADAGLSFDAARAILGAPWRDPSTEDFAELFDNIDYVDANGDVISGTNKLTTINSITGIRLKSKNNGNVIFFPCSGYGNGQSWNDRGSYGYYWSRSLYSQTDGRYLGFYSGGVYPQDVYNRFIGFARRAVQ